MDKLKPELGEEQLKSVGGGDGGESDGPTSSTAINEALKALQETLGNDPCE